MNETSAYGGEIGFNYHGFVPSNFALDEVDEHF